MCYDKETKVGHPEDSILAGAICSGFKDVLLHTLIRTTDADVVSMTVDPVCKMDVIEAQAKYTTVHEGAKYYFCSAACKQEFEKKPTKYISP